MANQITGRVFSIGQTQSIQTKNGNPFTKREIVLDASKYDMYTGEKGFENYPMFEFTGEKCKDLDGYQVGQVVTISFDIQGGFYDDKDGVKKNITKVRGYKIEARTSVQAQPQQQVQPQAASQPQYQSAPQQQEQSRIGYQPQPQYPQQQPQTPPPPGMNDLPFPV